jgi:hypothetical protein
MTATYSQKRNEKTNANFDLYITFNETFHFDSSEPNLGIITSRIATFEKTKREYGLKLEKGLLISDEKIMLLAKKAIEISGSDAPVLKLRNTFKITITNPTEERLRIVMKELQLMKEIENCSLISLNPIAPPHDIGLITPNYETSQGYIKSNPGVDMEYAWGLGYNGAGIKIRDVEYGFNKNHEDLDHKNVFIFPGMTVSSSVTDAYKDHGTAVVGVIYADKGTYGVSGMAYGASELAFFPEWQQTGYNRVNAVTMAINNSVAGDIIVYEMQTNGDQGNYVPAEYDYMIWNLTKAATAAGIIVVAAAGNGNQNLDGIPYNEYRTRGDSGAILVGAGSSNTAHDRLSFSTYGSRIDVQGWGQNVFTTGYGDIKIENDPNQGYISNFSGTSSATPIVASCVVVLQSYYHELTGNYMTSTQMRSLLKETGIAQGTGALGNIGPLPNMKNALLKIKNDNLSTTDFKLDKFTFYPNPIINELRLEISKDLRDPKIEIYALSGQLITSLKGTGLVDTIDCSRFAKGTYIIKLIDHETVISKKIFKK